MDFFEANFVSVVTLLLVSSACGAADSPQDSAQPPTTGIVALSPTSLQAEVEVGETASAVTVNADTTTSETAVKEHPSSDSSDPSMEDPQPTVSPIQREIIEWRTYQRQYTQERLPDGETAEQSACVVERGILALPEELLPQLTNPAREPLELATIDVVGAAYVLAAAECGGRQGLPAGNDG